MPRKALPLLCAMLHHGPLPDVFAYSALISACDKGRLPQGALQLLEAVLHQGILPELTNLQRVAQCL